MAAEQAAKETGGGVAFEMTTATLRDDPIRLARMVKQMAG